ncbi:MAG: hypothetical protein LAN70_08110 [Acidobacteriia bacterium]|nr:hypothetical protein [Terriglobia bacterium]
MLTLVRKPSVLFICFAAAAFAATKPDFSGTYTAQQKNDSKSTAASVVLRVVQSDSAVEVTRVNGDKSTTNRFPLDGSEGDYTTETGVRGKCKAHVKNETLVLESLVASPGRTDRPSIRFHTTEQWQLSLDRNTLTIKTDIKSPDMPPDVMAAAFPNNPRTEKYQRTDKP